MMVQALEEVGEGLEEDASKQGRMIDNTDQDVEIALVDETQGMMNEEDMFRVNDLDGDEVIVDITAKVARKLDGQMKAKIEEEERIARVKNKANIDVIEQWDEVQAKIDVVIELAQKLQTEEQEHLTDAEKARLFMEFLEKRRKFFARKRN
uniref:Uncharacterized protein n=1 Tax=Tanacetum cinerariifolium TaxID=118510 RepID=A0A699HMT3_TANCI|nr:hypothetical protein [Tanacetum cinerariifolium]